MTSRYAYALKSIPLPGVPGKRYYTYFRFDSAVIRNEWVASTKDAEPVKAVDVAKVVKLSAYETLKDIKVNRATGEILTTIRYRTGG